MRSGIAPTLPFPGRVCSPRQQRAVADDIAAKLHGSGGIDPYDGKGSCYIEFGGGLVGKVDADFLSGPSPKAPFLGPSQELAAEKDRFVSTRRRRWFGG
jgi:sulfide:quinone oxidoreductase